MQVSIGKIILHNDKILVFLAGCDFNCPYCNRTDIIESKQEYSRDLKEVIQEIREISKGTKEIIFTGGEPLLQRQALIQLLKESKVLNLKATLETNGSKPSVLRNILELNLINTIRISIKSPLDGMFDKVTRSQTFFITTKSILENIYLSIKVAKQHEKNLNIEIVTTIVPGLVFRKEDLEAIAAEIKDLDALWVLNQFSPDRITKSKVYANVSPPTEDFMVKLKEYINELHPNLRIEVRLYDPIQVESQQFE